jgi:hypothetical protein
MRKATEAKEMMVGSIGGRIVGKEGKEGNGESERE